MAVLWVELAERWPPESAGDLPVQLAGALSEHGLDRRVWRAGHDAAALLPDDLRGIEAVVVLGEAAVGVGEAGRPAGADAVATVDRLLAAARAADVPLLRAEFRGGPDSAGAGAGAGAGPGAGVGFGTSDGWRVVECRTGERGIGGTADSGDDPCDLHDPYDLCERFAERVTAGRDHALTRAFFTPRAVGWEKKFPDDQPVYRSAVACLRLSAGMAALDVGCGTGRALSPLREAVGSGGTVIGVDLTPAMVREAVRLGRDAFGFLAVADCLRLPVREAVLDGVFAAGLLHHVPDSQRALEELARTVRSGGRLALFHPVGRATLAQRHGRTLSDGDLLAEPILRPALAATGWQLDEYEDTPERFLAVAVRE